ncbi:hypothetical protein DMC14_002770 [Metamycoplasma phocicerebrale]|uniref:Uncharacterized protein n=1 Tax=Metamycoplasma phocicerebrale TaxID=142649 RepID=A0A3T0TUH7_9BACT|nr:hypothetical protein [Metamycoplasma phocicerebrale]AZZ65690.1 hypothetical protein DMC14_002770 [Metamycoplasma phocicerebrale]
MLADIKSAKEWLNQKDVTNASKIAINEAIATAEKAKLWATTNEDFKKIRETFNKTVADIKAKNGKTDTQKSNEDKIVEELKDIFVADNAQNQLAENSVSIFKKQIDLWYDRTNKRVIKTESGKNPKWKELTDKDVAFTLKEEAKAKIGGTQLVNPTNPTWQKDGKTNLSTKLEFETVVKKETINGDNKEIELEVTIKFKVATYNKDGDHTISTKVGQSKVTLNAVVPKDTPSPENPPAGNEIKEINDWVKTTVDQYQISSTINTEELKTALKGDFKNKKIDLYYDYKNKDIIRVLTGKFPDWKNLPSADRIFSPKDKSIFSKYQLMNSTENTYEKNNKTYINSKIDYEVVEEGTKIKVTLKYKGALYDKTGNHKLGTEEVSTVVTIE